MLNKLPFCVLALIACLVNGLSLGPTATTHKRETSIKTRRSVLSTFGAASVAPFIATANAGDAQFAEVGQQEKPPNGEAPFKTILNGVQIKDFREGGGPAVGKGSKVELTMKERLLNLNGVSAQCNELKRSKICLDLISWKMFTICVLQTKVIFYDTKSNDPNGFGEGTPLVFTVGDGTVLPGIESGIVGMQKGGIRRIIVPAEQGYGAYPALEPQPFTEMEKRALDSVVKNPRRDQTVLFDVKVERVR